jgi:hypothetical protein
MEYTSAPRWFWQPIRPPPPDVDWVIEHHDELVALPASRWESPVIKAWGRRLGEGACHAGGLVFVLVALASAFFRPKALHRPALLVCGGTALVSLLAYAMAPAWWTLATPAIAWLLIQLREDIRARPDGSTLSTRLAWICIAAQAASLPGSAQDRPGAAEYDYAKYLGQIEKRLADEGGKHLIFTRFNLAADPCVEPADLPRDWDRLRFLYARELGVEKDKSLVAAMPDRTPWVITIFRDSIGLLPWKKPAVPEKAEATSEKVEPAPPPATAAPQ